jgi:dTDP-4-amino-4,6-dideoxygalactose transaminase
MKKKNEFAPWPCFSEDEIAAVTRVLRSGKVNQWTGQEVFSFEAEYARALGVKYAVALANGSVALDIALLALDIGPGDEVIVPSRSFVASASCVALRKAIPVFADVDRESQNVTVGTIEEVFTRRTKAVIAVHLAGWPCELDAIRKFCDKRGIYLIEDCAQSHGAKYKEKPAGSFGDVACFSFCQDKIISTGGEGGLLVTNSEKIWQKAWRFKDHGRNYQKMLSQKDTGDFIWTVEDFGTNYRMTEMQAAIGRSMLAKLDEWVCKRRELSGILTQGFSNLEQLRVTIPSPAIYHAYYKYYVFVKPQALATGWNRDRIVRALIRKGVPCGTGVCPEIYLEKAFVKYRHSRNGTIQPRLPVARELGETSIMFQVHPSLREANMHRIIEEMDKVIRV